MKVLVIGAGGTIGSAVVKALRERNHGVVGVSRKGSPSVDITKKASIVALFDAVRDADAVVCCAGGAAWKPLAQLSDEDFDLSLGYKLMGQVNVIRVAQERLPDGGSITVTSGVLAQKPMPGSAAVSLVNAGLEGFVRAAALELPRGLRVNVVSPPWVKATLVAMGQDPAHGMAADDVARAYVASVEGKHQGAVLDPAHLPR